MMHAQINKSYSNHYINIKQRASATPWHNIWLSDNSVEVLNEHLSLLVGCYVPTKVTRVWNKDKTWFEDQCRHAFSLKQEAHLRWIHDHSRVKWEEFVCCQVRANETYSDAKRQFSDRNRNVLMNVQYPHKWWWWSTPKSAVFGSSSSLSPLVSEGGGLVYESVGKADLLLDHFDSKQSREAVDLPLICHPCPNFTTFAFRSSEVRHLLLDLDPYGGTDPLGVFPLFLKRTADVIAPSILVQCFGSLFVWVVSQLAGERPMSPQFRKVDRPLLLQITNQFPKHQY